MAASQSPAVSQAVRGLVTITGRSQSEWSRSAMWPRKRPLLLGPAWGQKCTQPHSNGATGWQDPQHPVHTPGASRLGRGGCGVIPGCCEAP